MAHTPKTHAQIKSEQDARLAAHAKKARERDEEARKEKAGESRLVDPAAGDDIGGRKLDVNAGVVQPQPRDVDLDAPSQIKNNLDQIVQPTGDGGIAGGKIPPVGETGSEEAPNTPKTVLVKLLKGYVPKGEFVVDKAVPAAVTGTGSAFKLHPGTTVRVSPDEARELIGAGVAERAAETL